MEALFRLAQTTWGRVVLAVIAVYAVIILGDGVMRVAGLGPYRWTYSGTIAQKQVSTWGTVVHALSGRNWWQKTERGARTPVVGPWRLLVRLSDGRTVEVAVPRRTYDAALPGMGIESRSAMAPPILKEAKPQ